MKRSETSSAAVLSIDIGNTRTHFGIITTDDHTCHAATAFSTGSIIDNFAPACAALEHKSAMTIPKTAVIASVVKTETERAARLLATKGIRTFTPNDRTSLPITFDYIPVDSLGIDRIANALFAYTLYPESPVILVCTGTAITIDIIRKKTFQGGAILPGLQMQLNALASTTAALPQVVVHDIPAIPALPAHNTADAMLSGVVKGTAAAVNGIVASYKEMYPAEMMPVIGTGGDWVRFAPLMQFEHKKHADATLIGTALLLPYCCAYNL